MAISARNLAAAVLAVASCSHAPSALVGRADGRGRYAWSATAVETRFRGPSIAVRIEVAPGDAPLPYTAWIDDRPPFTVLVGNGEPRVVLARDLDPAVEHHLLFVREGEAFGGVHRYAGLEAAELLPRRPRRRRLLVVGDSIACGYGVRPDKPDCHFSFATERATDAFAFLAARELDADLTLACWSGKGIHRNYDGDAEALMPDLFDRIVPTEPAVDREEPDAIVVELGTNDLLGKGGYDPAQFEAGYRRFVDRLRSRTRGNGRVFVMESPMIPPSRRHELRRVLDGLGVPVVPVAYQGDRIGCDAHPDHTMQHEMARVLAAAVLDSWR